MTIAALGAVLLGHIGEAAALAFLFSLAEALEDRSMDRAKQGLRALSQQVELDAARTPYDVYRRLDLGPGGYAIAPCRPDASAALTRFAWPA